MISPRPDLLELAAYVGGASRIEGANRVVKLSSNEGAFGPPPGAVQAHAEAASILHRYPDGGSEALRVAIGRAHGIDPARIVCDTGSDPIFSLLALAYGGPGTELLMSEHGFSIYATAATKAGMRVVRAPERELTTDVDALLARVTPATRMVMIANPNNPTGTFIPVGEVERLRRGLPSDVLLVLDAAYAEYVQEPTYEPGLRLVSGTDNTVMTRTFSKAYGLGGARLGWAFGPMTVIAMLNRIREPFGVNIAVQAAGIAALAETGWVERVREHNTRERGRLSDALTGLGLRVWPSAANFVLVDLGSPARALAADAHLRSRGLIVRNVASYGLPSCLRITIGTAEEVDLVVEAFEGWDGLEGG
jgi:histidinol-phosphate aminotransferase